MQGMQIRSPIALFFVLCSLDQVGYEAEVEEYIRRKFEDTVEKMVRVQKEDLDMVRVSLFC